MPELLDKRLLEDPFARGPADREVVKPGEAVEAKRRNIGARLRRGHCIALAAAMALSVPLVASAQERAIVLPMTEQTAWQVLQYRSLPPHRIRFSPLGLEMTVDGSAMPVIYPLPTPVRAKSIHVKGRVEGTLRIPEGRQGEDKFDDYAFRIGLVEPGERTLNFVQRQLAPAWVRKLFELAPKGGGIARIHFFNVAMDKTRIGQRRHHPLSDLIVEQVVAVPRPDGRFDFAHPLDRPLETIAVWLSSDGDDTGSRFSVFIEHIELR